MILQNSPKSVIQTHKTLRVWMLFNAKKSTRLWWETNSNQQSSREKETVVKRKTRAKRGFPSHKSSPKKERKKKRERKQESVTHSVDFFLLLLFLYFFTNAQLNRDTPMCCDRDREIASKAATLKETHKKRETTKNKPNLMLATRFTCCAQNVVPFFLSRARVTKVTPASRKTKRWEFTKWATSWTSLSSKQLSDHSEH